MTISNIKEEIKYKMSDGMKNRTDNISKQLKGAKFVEMKFNVNFDNEWMIFEKPDGTLLEVTAHQWKRETWFNAEPIKSDVEENP